MWALVGTAGGGPGCRLWWRLAGGVMRPQTGRAGGASTVPALVAVAAGDLLDEIHDAPAQLGIFDLHERLGQRQAVGRRQKLGHVSRRGRVLGAAGAARRVGSAVEQEPDRNLQYIGNLLEPAGADPIGALFVFLHLLEREAESVAELFLAHRQHHAP